MNKRAFCPHRFVLVTLALAWSWAVAAVPITFQVDMGLQSTLGAFTPGSDTVEVHGSFDNWGPGVTLAASTGNPAIYQGTVDVSGASGATIQYKFVINQSGALVWENNGVGPDGAQNRSFALPDAAQTLPVVYFNNQSAPPGTTRVTFQVDMGIQKSMGTF